jgi:site-specific DNA recombinase
MAKSINRNNGVTTALIYTRVSKDEMAREGVSLDAQADECRRYVATRGWSLGTEYKDVMRGTRDDRPQYQALLSEVRRLHDAGHTAVVVVAVLDRLGRRLLERVRCREELKRLGVETHSVRDGGEMDDLRANILASVAEEEVRRLSERTSAAKQHIMRGGWHPGGSRPWGYRARPATEAERLAGAPKQVLEIDAATAPYVQETFARIAGGESLRRAVAWLRTLPADVTQGRVFSHQVLREIISSPVYLGSIRPDTPQRWPALIERAIWEQVQAVLERGRRIPRQASGNFPLTGLLYCAKCGKRLSGWNRVRDRVRRSRAYRHGGNDTLDCLYQIEPAERLEIDVLARVLDLLAPVMQPGAPLHANLERAWVKQAEPKGVDAGALRMAEARANKARQRLTDAVAKLVDGEIDKAAYELLREREQAALDAARGEIERLSPQAPAPELPPLDTVLDAVGGWVAAVKGADITAQRVVLALLIERIDCTRTGSGRWHAAHHPDITWTPLGSALRNVAPQGLQLAG